MGIDVGHACSLQGSRGACVALAWAQYKHYLAFSRRMSRLNASSALSFWRRASILAAAFILAFSAKERSAAVLMVAPADLVSRSDFEEALEFQTFNSLPF